MKACHAHLLPAASGLSSFLVRLPLTPIRQETASSLKAALKRHHGCVPGRSRLPPDEAVAARWKSGQTCQSLLYL